MYILGINAYHADSSACIVHNGKLIFAIEEERLKRVKHWAGFPTLSIKSCLKICNIKLSDINYICINRDPKVNLFKKIFHILKYKPSISLIFDRLKKRINYRSINDEIKNQFPEDKFDGKIINVEHHNAHLASSFYLSPFDKSCIISVDGFGDFTSTAWGFGNGLDFKVDDRIFFPHSLGILYQSITQFLGFKDYGDEYKVMGLAPYGKPTFTNKLKELLILNSNGKYRLNLKYFKFHKENINYRWYNGDVYLDDLYTKELVKLLGPERLKEGKIEEFHKDIAHSLQNLYEEAFFNILNNLYKKYKNENICISGGCGMNSVANGKIKDFTPFKNIFVQPAAGDAGGAIGSSYYLWHKILNKNSRFQMKHSYYGNSFDNNYVDKLLKENKKKLNFENCKIKYFDLFEDLNDLVANHISDGKVVGWFQDKMEWGPRALGNRSILADPRKSNMKDILNIKIKKRESFRPFAPSIMREHVKDWFETDDEVPFMMKVYQIQKKKRSVIPAVTHVDGSGRLQTVNEETNKKYYNLIKKFYEITKVPLILNTSFNENEPITNTPEEALDCFLRTKMDILVLQNYVIER